MGEQEGGTYTLCLELATPAEIEVGALGANSFDSGWYAYVGSALGSGGFSRVERHRELAAGKRDTRHWHIDYLLGHSESRLDSVVKTTSVDGECAVASALDSPTITDFGCSDCSCETHLFFASTREQLLSAVEDAHNLLSGATAVDQFR
ncbi:GIY-YIG nuclease family protein [Halovenus halobia]|uniref:GIY-YIG nuclease family protein n=1 Tax=Halovenus halobia TaxID=3396622 RepID=UPI003F560924